MREATGGVLLLHLVILILSVFIFFIGSTMQYTRVYRIKGTIINAIERNEGGIKDKDEFERILANAGYAGPYTLCKCSSGTRGVFYAIEMYASYTLLPQYGSIAVPIRGNTRSIESGVFYKNSQESLFGTSSHNSSNTLCGSETTKGCIKR
jgi:hypothetical protein